jgi:flagellar biogenesis protein FliO
MFQPRPADGPKRRNGHSAPPWRGRALQWASGIAMAHWPTAVYAHQSAAAATSYGDLTLRMIGGLVFVSLAAYAGLRWGLGRHSTPGPGPQELSLAARLPIEPRRSVLIIETNGERFLIGSSEHGLHPLGRLEKTDTKQAGME